MIRNKISNLINNRDSGFTIVELLIVIVVIGILAAITIVSYTGITQQATTAQYKQDTSSIVSVAEIIYNQEGAYPLVASGATLPATDFADDVGAKLPANVTVGTTLSSAPADAAAATPTVASGVTTYKWWACAGGINVYYPEGGAVKVVKAGAGCS